MHIQSMLLDFPLYKYVFDYKYQLILMQNRLNGTSSGATGLLALMANRMNTIMGTGAKTSYKNVGMWKQTFSVLDLMKDRPPLC